MGVEPGYANRVNGHAGREQRQVSGFSLQKCARPTMLTLLKFPYNHARAEFEATDDNILLDANENNYGPALPPDSSNFLPREENLETGLKPIHRYPDPHLTHLKERLSELRSTYTHTSKPLTPANVFISTGSDDILDTYTRVFCEPAKEKLLVTPPTYAIYSGCGIFNDVGIVKVPLISAPGTPYDFDLDVEAVNRTLTNDPSIKIVFICSPGNPTGKAIAKPAIEALLTNKSYNGLVIIDEAYIDFVGDSSSLAEWVNEWPNLVVIQTLSKAFGLAGIRIGAAFSSEPVTELLNNFKAPYHVPSPSSQLALEALSPAGLDKMRANRATMIMQRMRAVAALSAHPSIGRLRGGTDASFVLFEVLDAPHGAPCNASARALQEAFAKRRIVVRSRANEPNCTGTVRMAIGTEAEMDRVLPALAECLDEMHAASAPVSVPAPAKAVKSVRT